MSQLSAGVTVDEGYREVAASSSSTRTRSPVEARADRVAPGVWDEDLGRLGNERWELPGQGEAGPRCGIWQPAAVCDTHGHVEYSRHTCGRRECPDCWSIWAKKSGVRATKRVQAFRHTLPKDASRQTGHASLNPPEGSIRTKREFWKGKKKAAEMAKQKGFRGFAVIAHPFRVTDEGEKRYHEEEPDNGIWVWLRNDIEDMREYIYWSPHYHIIGLMTPDMDPGTDDDEWVYELHRTVEAFEGIDDSKSHEDLYGLFRYLLSHTGYPEGSSNQTVTWYGDLANNVFVEDPTGEWQYEKPSVGVRDALERHIEAVAGVSVDDDEEGGGADDDDMVGECSVEGCEGRLVDVFDINAYLRQTNPPPDVRERMQVARDWRLWRVVPPPGLRSPRCEEEAREAFEAIL